MQGSHKPVGAHNDGTLREFIVILGDSLEIIPCCVCLTDGARR